MERLVYEDFDISFTGRGGGGRTEFPQNRDWSKGLYEIREGVEGMKRYDVYETSY